MSRSGYSDDYDGWDLICWRGAVASAIRGKRGQAFLRELLAALDAMPEKRLIAYELEADGSYCALGAIGAKRDIALVDLNPDDWDQVAAALGIAPALVREVTFMNDEAGSFRETEEDRWRHIRAWVAAALPPVKEEQR